MRCYHQFAMLRDQIAYQWCVHCGSLFHIEKMQMQVPKLLNLVKLDVELNDLEKTTCHAGNKINTIKLLRDRTGLSLNHAKQIVDEHVSKNPIKPFRPGFCSECGSSFEEDATPQMSGTTLCFKCS